MNLWLRGAPRFASLAERMVECGQTFGGRASSGREPSGSRFEIRSANGRNASGMLQVVLRDGESPDSLLNRFTKMIQKDGILREVKARRHFISAGERERIAQRKADARRRRRKARQRD